MSMKLADIVETSRRVGEVGGRLAKIGHLASCLARAGPQEVAGAVAVLSGMPRQGRIGVGYAALRAARGEKAAAEASITLAELERALEGLKAVKGKGAAGERVRLLRELFGRATEAEQDFLLRLLVGRAAAGCARGRDGRGDRQGGRAAGRRGPPRGDARGRCRRGRARGARRGAGGARALRARSCSSRCSRCWRSRPRTSRRRWRSLARRRSSGSSMARASRCTRIGDEVRVFTRRLNDVTAAVPEVVSAVQALPLASAILDGEAIALRPDGRPQPFQVTMRRFGRKLDVERLRAELPLALPVLRRAGARWRGARSTGRTRSASRRWRASCRRSCSCRAW